MQLVFSHPEPAPQRAAVWPVFLPFAGCPYRCVYCAQDKQTGRGEAELEDVFRTAGEDLGRALDEGRGPYELAFYGGTFTALPWAWQARFLELGARFRECGLVTRVRCSTRPDRVDAAGLDRLRAAGLDLVELGVQSFDDAALRAASRGYAGDVARAACGLVRAAGLGLGIQLMPGLPGDRPGMFRADAAEAAALSPEVARLYPCLVIRGTALAEVWARGGFTPWTLERAGEELAAALPVLWERGVRVIRLGLAPEGTLAEHILAGPWHPALGQTARGRALLAIIRARLDGLDGPVTLFEAPRRYQGEFFGHRNELAAEYAALGIGRETVRWVAGDEFRLTTG
ncbi:radical SAM protein [Pseudodesulfovibrio sp.]|uniref:elongator complex protein 3 n=1 Tax=Pseudodesulfovibrio sp. TaxID=2035812 RepID=UPI002603CCB2|nr:radical SAM protein [Pseudodesulfovibrio sp.]MDD3312414.1 radical SAM protein [Pseudodesulfovibrio sp.]